LSKAVVFALPVTGVLLGGIAGCKVDEPMPFDPRLFTAPYREAAQEAETPHKRPLPTTLESEFLSSRDGNRTQPRPNDSPPPSTGRALAEDPTIRLPLQEIVQRAVANNLDVKVAGYGPAIESTRVVEAEARYDPIFFTNLQYEKRDRGQASTFATLDQADVLTGQTGLRQNLPSGGQAELRYQASRTDVRSDQFGTFTPNPFYESDLVLQFTQPILRDFGNTVNRARIVISRNNQRISLLDFRRQLEETLAEIEQVYWQLVQAERDIAIQEELVQYTYRTAEILSKRQGQDVTRVQLSQATSRLEQRRATLVRTRARARDLSDRLKRLMNDPDLPVGGPTLLLPATPAVTEPLNFDLADQIETAMENRLELGQQQLRVNSADIARDVARNNLLPQLNVVGSLSVQGIDDSYGDALDDQADLGNFGWAVGLQFEIPIGNRAARATYRRALLQQNQAIDQYRQLVNTIAEEVSTAARDVQTTWDEMVASNRAKRAAADALLAVQQREDAGEVLSPTFVQLKLDQQSELAIAAGAEAQAISSYQIALARLEQAKGTLLRYNNVIMEEGDPPLARR
jgi:outer membrane protein TolC